MAVGKGEGGVGEWGGDRTVDEIVMEKSAKSQGSAFIWSRFQQLATRPAPPVFYRNLSHIKTRSVKFMEML